MTSVKDFCHHYRVLHQTIKPELESCFPSGSGLGIADPTSRFLLRVVLLYCLGLQPSNSFQESWDQAHALVPGFFHEFPLDLIPKSVLRTVTAYFDPYSFGFSPSLSKDPRPWIAPATLRQAFEALTSKTDRKSRGIFHTPPDVVEYLVRQSLLYWLQTQLSPSIPPVDLESLIQGASLPERVADQAPAIDRALAEIKILDPAVGAGVFPVTIVRHIGTIRQTLTPYLHSAQQTNRTLAHLYTHTLHHSIYGVDLDLAAVEMSCIQLWFLLWETDPVPLLPLPHLLWGDTLATQNSHLFLEIQFQSVLQQQQGFDLVIGNPPYVRIHKQDIQTRQQIRQHFQSAQGNFDLYILFFEVGLRLLKPDGILAYITPDKFLVREYGYQIRQLILQYSILEFFDLSRREQTFSAATYPLISILQKNDHTPYIQFKFTPPSQELSAALPITVEKSRIIANPTIELCPPQDQALLHKILQQSERLSHFIDRHQIFCGTPRARDYHTWGDHILPQENLKHPIHSPSLRLLVCAHLRPYEIQFQKQVRTLGHRIQEPYFTNSSNIINPQRWADFCLAPKLLIRGNDTRITAVLDEIGSVFIGIYGIKITGPVVELYPYLLGLLNSTLYQWILSVQNPSIRIAGGFFSINAPHILQLPFKVISEPERFLFEALVAQILNLTRDRAYATRPDLQNQVKICQNSLDRLIYTLYQLTEDEIARVESLKSPPKTRHAPSRYHDRSHPLPEEQAPLPPRNC